MSAVEPGQLRRKRLLESEATYRVVEVADEVVEVEVIDAPGLKPGQRFSFTTEVVEAMEVVAAAETATPPASGI
jgi:hypothetical protein